MLFIYLCVQMMYYSFRTLDYIYVFPSKLDNRIRLFFLVKDTEHLIGGEKTYCSGLETP